jgi:transmembrane sensor
MELMKHERTLQEAARIYARLQAVDCTQTDRDAARAWQADDPEHRRALELADRVSAGIATLATDERFDQKLRALADEALAAYPARAPQLEAPRRWRVAAGLAASIVLSLACAWQISSFVATPAQSLAYESLPGERRLVTLDDGSVVQMDVNTRLGVRMDSQRRQIELLSGRALFEVAHDSARPFSVSAAGSLTTALGTKFQVQRDDTRVVVTLTQGSVAVDREERAAAGAAWHERLIPGEQISIDTANNRRTRRLVDVHASTSWTQGRHIFRGTPLQSALDEVNRYAAKKVRLGDPSLAELPVAGNFIIGDSAVVVDAFAAVLPLRVANAGGSELILFRSHGP